MAKSIHGAGQETLTPALIIPTYQRPTGLLTAVESGLAALPQDSQLIVIDDGITHPAKETLARVADPRIRIEKTNGKQGPAAARNLGVTLAVADIIFFLDDDDALAPDYVSRVLDVLCRQMPDCDYGFSAITRDGAVSRKLMRTGPMLANTDLSEKMGGLGMGFWIRRSLFLTVGGLDETIRINEDTEFCLRLADRKALGWYEAEPGVAINPGNPADMLDDQPSLTKTSSQLERAQVFEMFLEKYSDLLANNEKLRQQFAMRAVKYIAQAKGTVASLEKAKLLMPNKNLGLLCARLLVWRAASILKQRRTKIRYDVK